MKGTKRFRLVSIDKKAQMSVKEAEAELKEEILEAEVKEEPKAEEVEEKPAARKVSKKKEEKPEDVIGVRKDIARINLVLRERELASK